MDMQEQQPARQPNPRRRRRSKMRIFKEVYLPTIILAVTAVFVLVFIIGGSVRRGQEPQLDNTVSTQSTAATTDPNQAVLLAQEAKDLMARAAVLADSYDYAGAVALLETFSGQIAQHAELAEVYNTYKAADAAMITWTADQVPNLSFHVLIADASRAFPDKQLGSSYRRNFITVGEFIAILDQLYANGYILVDMDTLYTTHYSDTSGRDVYTQNSLRLPANKKPIMLTEVNASYYTYMVDSDGDNLPDAGGDGFASKLSWDAATGFYNHIVNADGSSTTGAYDMVPILEAFIAQHPDFSYQDARATIAFTGSDGILGYRTNSAAFDEATCQLEREGAAATADALRDAGYTLACYTYANVDYNTYTATQIQSDMQKWSEDVTSVIGPVDVLVFARDSDIGDTGVYNGSKFTLLYNMGFRYFMGVSESPWFQINDLYVRHNRLMITGDNLTNHPELFSGIFDAAAVLDPARNNG